MKNALTVMLAVVIAGCGSQDVATVAAPITSPQHQGAEPEDPELQPGTIPAEAMLQREATVALEVEDCARTMDAITKLASEAHGVVVSSDLRAEAEVGRRSGATVFRVPAAAFERALDDLDALALVPESRNVTATDVTEEYVDLEARLGVKRALEARYLQLVQGLGSTSEALEVERSLAAVREDIERIEGRRRYLASRVELSTITVTFHEPEPLLGELHWAFGLGRHLSTGVVSAIIVVVVGLSPLALIVMLVVLAGRALIRSRRARVGA
jgi:hypothetical protein